MTTISDAARKAAEKIERVFGKYVSMHVNDLIPDIQEAISTETSALRARIEMLEAALAAARFRFEYLASEAMRLEMPIAMTTASEGALAAHKALEAKDE